MEARREQLRNAGLWKATIPGPREAMAIIVSEDKTVSMIVDELLPAARPCSGTLPR